MTKNNGWIEMGTDQWGALVMIVVLLVGWAVWEWLDRRSKNR